MGGGSSIAKAKIPDPPTFAGSENKMQLQDWLNQLVLFCTASGTTTDKQKIIAALSRLRAPASTYMRHYFDKNTKGEDLGTWDTFVSELKSIYGQRDDKEGAKKEITALWSNKDLAKKNFVKYVECYCTLACIVSYTDEVHIDKLKDVVPDDLCKSLIMYELSDKMPNKWDNYIKLLMQAYKALHPEKAQGTIFGDSGNGKNGGNDNRDPNAMEIDQAKKGKGKEANSTEKAQKYCQICGDKGKKSKAKSHNTADCYDKPGNENKRPQYKSTTAPSSSKPSSSSNGSYNGAGKNKSFKSRLLELLNTMGDDDNDEDSPTKDVVVNSATIEEVFDPKPAAQGAIAHVDDVPKGSRVPTGPIGTALMDFPKGL